MARRYLLPVFAMAVVFGVMPMAFASHGATVATLPIGQGTDAAAFDPTRKLIFTSNGMDGTLSVIREVDANTFVPAATIKTALSARTMSVDPVSGRVFLAAAATNAKAMAAFRETRARPSGKATFVPTMYFLKRGSNASLAGPPAQ